MYSEQGHAYIDPKNCGSSIGFRLFISEYAAKDKPPAYSLVAYVRLADCSHFVEWSFDGDTKTDTEKIDVAISQLQTFRKKFIEASKLTDKLNKK